ncbi:CRISPR-associated endonuclease Cas2 [Planctomicrobium sp. SH668]|uniref:CRISPR-associated endonuclease Cas2 n=1 Tax=Planctomicrobium sp. SH668 TaxID=3448126 RepID=UPI003F5B8A8E
MQLSNYRSMWLIAMFDLPTDTKLARKQYARFRKFLLQDGFQQVQYSVYGRHCISEEAADVHFRRLEHHLPPDGEVRLLAVTDRQYERMRIYWGKKRQPCTNSPKQLSLF